MCFPETYQSQLLQTIMKFPWCIKSLRIDETTLKPQTQHSTPWNLEKKLFVTHENQRDCSSEVASFGDLTFYSKQQTCMQLSNYWVCCKRHLGNCAMMIRHNLCFFSKCHSLLQCLLFQFCSPKRPLRHRKLDDNAIALMQTLADLLVL